MRRSIALVAASVAFVAAGAPHAATPIVYGYPYAADCPAAGIADAVDRWNMDECNCTSFVAWALSANGQRTDWFVPGAMDAFNWPHVAELAGLPVGTTPRVGAVVVWPHVKRFGHVAYVTALDRDGRFDVAEYNLPVPFGFDVRRDVSRAGAEFIYVPAEPRAGASELRGRASRPPG
ncbi:MAG TPA: CHAP domain-containing protein [Gaiellaceae bacterium]|nr:CHAP domain-containing protein [Gaiellaceae bacterium]